jgi:hypothetical protein
VARQRPIPAETTRFRLRSKLLGVHKKGKGALAETESTFELDGQTYVRIVSGAFLVGANGFQVSSCQFISVVFA